MPSCTSGSPLELEKRTTVGTACPCRCSARLTARAPAEARNVPEQTIPLACTGRTPGCGRASDRMVSTSLATTVADAGDPDMVGLLRRCGDVPQLGCQA